MEDGTPSKSPGSKSTQRSPTPASTAVSSANPFDPMNLLGSMTAQSAAALASQMYNPAALSFMGGGNPYFPSPLGFGGLGAPAGFNPMLSPNSSTDWWRAMNEQSRRLDEAGSSMFGMGLPPLFTGASLTSDPGLGSPYGLPPWLPPYTGFSMTSSPTTAATSKSTTATATLSSSTKLSSSSSSKDFTSSVYDHHKGEDTKCQEPRHKPGASSHKGESHRNSESQRSSVQSEAKDGAAAASKSLRDSSSERGTPLSERPSLYSPSREAEHRHKRSHSDWQQHKAEPGEIVREPRSSKSSSSLPMPDPSSLFGSGLANPLAFPGLFPPGLDPLASSMSSLYFPFGSYPDLGSSPFSSLPFPPPMFPPSLSVSTSDTPVGFSAESFFTPLSSASKDIRSIEQGNKSSKKDGSGQQNSSSTAVKASISSTDGKSRGGQRASRNVNRKVDNGRQSSNRQLSSPAAPPHSRGDHEHTWSAEKIEYAHSKKQSSDSVSKAHGTPIPAHVHDSVEKKKPSEAPASSLEGVLDLSIKTSTSKEASSHSAPTSVIKSGPNIGEDRKRQHNGLPCSEQSGTRCKESKEDGYEKQKQMAERQMELANEHAQYLANQFQQNISEYYMYLSLMQHPMFDANSGLMIPPPPPPSSLVGSRGRRGAGGRGSRGRRSGGSPTGSDNSGSGTGRSGRGRPRGNKVRGRARNVESRSLAELAMEFHRRQMEEQLLQHCSTTASATSTCTSTTQQSAAPSSSQKLSTTTTDTATANGASMASRRSGVDNSTLVQALAKCKGVLPGVLDELMMGQKAEETLSEDSHELQSSSFSDEDSMATGDDNSGGLGSYCSAYDSDATSSLQQDGDSGEEGGGHRRRRRTIFDETEIRIPLEHGWRRETRIREVDYKGVHGEVSYFTPCGKKLKSFVEVERYLEKANITDLTKENFTFSSNVNVGDFYDTKDGENFEKLSEPEVLSRFIVIEERKQRILERRKNEERRLQRKRAASELGQNLRAGKIRKHDDHQELARKVAEIKLRRKLERQQSKNELRKAKQQKLLEKQRDKDQQRQLKLEQELRAKQERELRTQQLMEEREVRRQQEVVQREQERERRRQHILMVKAMEARKRLEEKERLKEQKRNEKKLDKERRLEQKRMELEINQQLKKPVDDMCLRDLRPLPELERVAGMAIPGEAYANSLMVMEFCLNFKDALKLDKDQLPNMTMLQGGLLNIKDYMDDFMQFTTNLLAIALDEPGVPNIKEAVTSSGDKITTIDITDYSISEVLRVFIRCRNGKDDEMSESLRYHPYQCLNATQKSAILAFLCNEILCGEHVSSEMEKNIDKVNNLRRDKWEIDNELRRLKMIRNKKFKKSTILDFTAENSEMTGSCAATPNLGLEDSVDQVKKKDEDSDEDSEDEQTHDDKSLMEAEEAELPLEELDKRIEKLAKQQNTYRHKVHDVAQKLRAVDLGQDRYHRRFWVLPHCGGVYCEGMESTEVGGLNGKEEEIQSLRAELPCNEEYVQETEPEIRNIVLEPPTRGELEEMKEEQGKTEEMQEESKQKILKNEPEMRKEEPDKRKEEPEKKKEETDKAKGDTKEESDFFREMKNSRLFSFLSSDFTAQSNCFEIEEPVGLKLSDLKRNLSLEAAATSGSENSNHSMSKSPVAHEYNKFNGHLSDGGGLKVKGVKLEGENYIQKFERLNLKTHPQETRGAGLPQVRECGKTGPKEAEHKEGRAGLLQAHRGATVEQGKDLEAKVGEVIHKSGDVIHKSVEVVHKSVEVVHKSVEVIHKVGEVPHKGDKLLPTPVDSAPKDLAMVKEEAVPKEVQCKTERSDGPVDRPQKDSDPKYKNAPWFRMLPTKACDNSSILHTSSAAIKTANLLVTFPDIPVKLELEDGGNDGVGDAPAGAEVGAMCGGIKQDLTSILKDIQFTEPQPIALDKQCGWWKVGPQSILQQLLTSLHSRGVRERNLLKNLKHDLDYTSSVCAKTNQLTACAMSDPALMAAHIHPKVCASLPDLKGSFSRSMLLEVDRGVLEEVQDMEDRICVASLQVKGYTQPNKVTDDDNIDLVQRRPELGELASNQRVVLELAKERLLLLERNIERRYLKPPLCKQTIISLSALSTTPSRDNLAVGTPESAGVPLLEDSLALVNEDSMSAHTDGSRETSAYFSEADAPKELIAWRTAVSQATNVSQVACCLLRLQHCIAWEKSVMRVTCQICCKDDNEAELLLCDGCDKGYHTYCFKPRLDLVPEGDWYCYECISKVTGDQQCVVCGKRPGRMISCVHCHRIQHLECTEPLMSRIPRKWACTVCILAGKCKGKKRKAKISMSVSDKSEEHCPNDTSQTSISSTPLDSASCTKDSPQKETTPSRPPPLKKIRSNSTVSSKCSTPKLPTEKAKECGESGKAEGVKGKGKKKKKREDDGEDCVSSVTESSHAMEVDDVLDTINSVVAGVSNDERAADEDEKEDVVDEDVKALQVMTDLSPCRQLLTELELHEEGWPFLEPVDNRQFPQYRKLIKKPMDFRTVGRKLRRNEYMTREDFASDIRLIFRNCEFFNEDESPVGKAGHAMQQYFEAKWQELCSKHSNSDTSLDYV